MRSDRAGAGELGEREVAQRGEPAAAEAVVDRVGEQHGVPPGGGGEEEAGAGVAVVVGDAGVGDEPGQAAAAARVGGDLRAQAGREPGVVAGQQVFGEDGEVGRGGEDPGVAGDTVQQGGVRVVRSAPGAGRAAQPLLGRGDRG
ncbi:hypothetical protein KNE206_69400 [Kitasatospora sp. NE20-6]